MLCVLEIAFGQNSVARRGGVLGHCHVFFDNLISGAADADFRAIAVKHLGAVIAPVMSSIAAVAAMSVTSSR